METIITVIGLVLFGILALTAFGMTITKKDMDDFDSLSRFVDIANRWDIDFGDACYKEWQRLHEGGRVPTEMLEELRRRIIKKFR